MELCNCFHSVVVVNILLAMTYLNEFFTWERNYADGQDCKILAVELLSLLAFMKSYVCAYAS
jgi:hypothetical protein